jgi:hypothetical protein
MTCIFAALYLAHRNKTIRLRQRYRPYPVPYREWAIPSVVASREYLAAVTGYSPSQISLGLNKLVRAGFIARQEALQRDLRDSNNQFTVPHYTHSVLHHFRCTVRYEPVS